MKHVLMTLLAITVVSGALVWRFWPRDHWLLLSDEYAKRWSVDHWLVETGRCYPHIGIFVDQITGGIIRRPMLVVDIDGQVLLVSDRRPGVIVRVTDNAVIVRTKESCDTGKSLTEHLRKVRWLSPFRPKLS